MEATGFAYDSKAKPGDGRTYCLVLEKCPACAERVEAYGGWVKPRTAHVAVPSGTLRCEEHLCPAGGAGLGLASWVGSYAPWASHDLLATIPEERVQEVTLADADREDGPLATMIGDAATWAGLKQGRVAVVCVTPPGAGKTREVIRRLAESQQGTLLAPRHLLSDEQRAGFARAGGRASRKHDGVLRRLRATHPGLASSLTPVEALGFSARAYLLPEERPQVVDGEGDVAFGVHAHRASSPVVETPDPNAPGKALPGPVFLDELPPMLQVTTLPIEQIALLTGEQLYEETVAFAQGLAPIARVAVKAARLAAEHRQQLPRDKTRFPERLRGDRLGRLLVEAAGGQEALLAAAQASRPTRNAGWLPPAGFRPLAEVYPVEKGDHRWYLPIYYRHRHTPRPPFELARSGKITEQTWPYRLVETALTALMADASCLRLQGPPGFSACMVVSGRGESVRVAIELRRRWSWTLPGRASIVIVDATAHLVEDALRAAWDGWEVKFFRLKVKPVDPEATKRVWVQTAPSTYARSSLYFPRQGNGPRQLRPRTVPALVRFIDTAVEQTITHMGPGRTLALIIPKGVKLVLDAARKVAEAHHQGREPDPVLLDRVQADGAERLVGCLQGHLEAGRIAGFRLAHQLAVAGTNRLESSDALVTMPFTPNIGAIAEDARALGVDPGDLIRGLREAELIQEQHRLRPLRATQEEPKLLIHFGDTPPADWSAGYDHVRGKAGGRVPTYQRRQVEALVTVLAAMHGAVSASFIMWAAAEPDLYRALPSTSWPLAAGVHTGLVVAASLPERALRRAVATALPAAAQVPAPHPLPGGRGTWKLREVRPGAAAALVAQIKNTYPGVRT